MKSNNWEVVKTYPLSSVKDILDSLVLMNPIEQEGYVVVDASFNRIKVKSPQYVALHHTTSNMSVRRMLEIIRVNENDEFLSYFPEWKELYNKVKNKYLSLLTDVAQTYEQFKSIENQKEFALKVKDLRYAGALFVLRSGKIKNLEEYFAQYPIKRFEELLDLKDQSLSSGG